jgi:tRNA (mo5U34)-methyltransferase
VRIGRETGEPDREHIRESLQALLPWRKGPFEVHGVGIDAEWRANLKWARISPHLSDLRDRRVLDVGCGNGYYALRMLGSGARWVLGADPTRLFSLQYRALRRFMPPQRFWLLPAPLEDVPLPPEGVDTVFSMGVLYHRRSPFDHLARLRRWLRAGGELVLETLVIEGGPREVLVPPARYARMRNVWFLPSVPALRDWLGRAGFDDVRCVDVTATTPREQRRTDWMPFDSLDKALDPSDSRRTLEGHPAPLRAVLLARRR